jgi:hypothetical protein
MTNLRGDTGNEINNAGNSPAKKKAKTEAFTGVAANYSQQRQRTQKREEVG